MKHAPGKNNGLLLFAVLLLSAIIAAGVWGVVLPSVRQTLSAQQLAACRATYFVKVTAANNEVTKSVAKVTRNSGEIQVAAINGDHVGLDALIAKTPDLSAEVDVALAKQDTATEQYGKAATLSLVDPAKFLETC